MDNPAMDSATEVKYGRGQNPRSLANLRPWKKGEQPNPTGRQGPVITPRIMRMLEMDPQDFFRLVPKTVADVVAMGYVYEAMQSGYDRGRTEVIERADGKVKDIREIEVTEHRIETVYVDTPRPELRRVK